MNGTWKALCDFEQAIGPDLTLRVSLHPSSVANIDIDVFEVWCKKHDTPYVTPKFITGICCMPENLRARLLGLKERLKACGYEVAYEA